MIESLTELLWNVLELSPWVRRTFFALLTLALLFFGWWSWRGLAFVAAIWFALELPDLIALATGAKKR
ncbi:MAG: hypothetical protein WC807_01645 [Hyphomicrobium sp.]|jgi:hypothetical protein